MLIIKGFDLKISVYTEHFWNVSFNLSTGLWLQRTSDSVRYTSCANDSEMIPH